MMHCGIAPGQEAPVDGATPPTAPSAGVTEARSSVVDPTADAGGGDQQIEVRGGTPKARVLFRSYARGIRDDFRWELYTYRPGERQSERTVWKSPIRIELWGDVTDVFRGDDTRAEVELRPDNRIHLRVAVRLHDHFEEDSFRLEMVRALVLEHMLLPIATTPSLLEAETLSPPSWVVHGFDELLEHKQAGRPSGFYEGALRSGQILDPDQLFSITDPEGLDSLNFAIFRASSAAMVETLLDQPDGDISFLALLADFGRSPGVAPESLLRQHFPAFREMDEGIEKWWILQVASLGQQQRFEFMNPEETERWLTEALTIRFVGGEEELPNEEGKRGGLFRKLIPSSKPDVVEEPFQGTLEQYAEFLDRPQAREKLLQCFDRLQQLRMTGFPLYRPVIEGYEQVVMELAKDKPGDVEARLAALADLRRTIGETLVRAEDYMNYYEATRAPRRSETFEEYMKLRRDLDREEAPHRKDRISRYLDALESEFR